MNNFTEGTLRVWWIPQVPGSRFYVYVSDIKEAKKILSILSDYDFFQFENNIKQDYCNAGGLMVFDSERVEWEDWYNEEGKSINEVCEKSL